MVAKLLAQKDFDLAESKHESVMIYLHIQNMQTKKNNTESLDAHAGHKPLCCTAVPFRDSAMTVFCSLIGVFDLFIFWIEVIYSFIATARGSLKQVN